MAETILDASALLALMRGEEGADQVAGALAAGCAIGAVNLAEVLSKLAEAGADPGEALARLRSIGDGLEIVGMEPEDAVVIAQLRPLTRGIGLSIADRACLALARRLGLPVLTADRSWTQADAKVQVVLIRDGGRAAR